jgi:effector-binding domain-containing protein
MTEFTILDLPEQHTVGIRRTVRMDALVEFFDSVYGQVFAAMQEAGVAPTGAPFARYRGEIGETADIEGGFPVAEPFPASGELVAGSLPAGRAVEAVHVGPYDTLVATYAELEGWLADQGLRAGSELWEVYDSGPASDPDPATWRTRLVQPVVPTDDAG